MSSPETEYWNDQHDEYLRKKGSRDLVACRDCIPCAYHNPDSPDFKER